MILQSLVQYYEALADKGKITRPGWCDAKVSYALDISKDGQLLGATYLKWADDIGKKTVWRPQELKVPQMLSRSSGIAPNFLCDNSTYMLGIDKKGKPDRSKECFESAQQKHKEILDGVSVKEAYAILSYFEKWKPEDAEEHPALKDILDDILAGANIIFSVDGRYAQEIPEIAAAWEVYNQQPGDGKQGICLVTGERAEIARTHGTFQGVQGAQSSGAALVSFNAPAFESYGKEQSYNAPVGSYAVYAYTTGLSKLLADRKHVTTIGDTTVVYWAEDGEEIYQNVFAAVSEPMTDNLDIVDAVFKNLKGGKAISGDTVLADLNLNQRFYILGLAPNAARIAVRFFYQDSFGSILANMKAHYDRLSIVKPSMDRIDYLGTWRLLQETVNKKSRDKKAIPNMAGALYRAVISGSRYPDALYHAVLGRIRAEQDSNDTFKITRGRAAIIKAYLLKNKNMEKEEITVALNENSNNIAYILGREFAVLEAIQAEANRKDTDQKDVNPGINTTIKSRYFNSACATPAIIFPILFKLKNSHIRKIKKEVIKMKYEMLLGELQDKLTVKEGQEISCPKRLSLEEQGMFILGYYHQTQIKI